MLKVYSVLLLCSFILLLPPLPPKTPRLYSQFFCPEMGENPLVRTKEKGISTVYRFIECPGYMISAGHELNEIF